jgi:phosphomannomutase
MISVTGKSPVEIMKELETQFGVFEMVEDNLVFQPEYKETVNKTIMVDKTLPEFKNKIARVNYEDGCKVYFENGDFVICRFSGTEPLLRIFAESSNEVTAREYVDAFRILLKL